MDQDDPEKRIAELERQLFEHMRIAEPRSHLDRGVDLSHPGAGGDAGAMPVSRESAAPCRFVAFAPRLRPRVGYLLMAGSAVSPLFAFVLYLFAPHVDVGVVHIVVMASFVAIFAVYRVGWISRDVSIDLTSDSLIVNDGIGGVFPLRDGKLCRWGGRYTALQLRNADRRFVLGGREYPLPAGARHDAKPVYSLDAWMPAPAFHALLNMVFR